MKLFTLQCGECSHIWQDFHKSYLCPQCHKTNVEIIDAPYREGVFTEGGHSNLGVTLYLIFMIAMVAAMQFLANGAWLK